MSDVSPLVVLRGFSLGRARRKRATGRRGNGGRHERQGGLGASFAVYGQEAAWGEDIGLLARASGDGGGEWRWFTGILAYEQGWSPRTRTKTESTRQHTSGRAGMSTDGRRWDGRREGGAGQLANGRRLDDASAAMVASVFPGERRRRGKGQGETRLVSSSTAWTPCPTCSSRAESGAGELGRSFKCDQNGPTKGGAARTLSLFFATSFPPPASTVGYSSPIPL